MSIKDCEYRHQQWGPTYFDCIGATYWGGDQAEAMYFKDGDEEGAPWRGYSDQPDPKFMHRALRAMLVELPTRYAAMIADVVWFRDPLAQHLGIVTHTTPYICVIHASLNKECVMHEQVRRPYRIVGAFRYPKVQEALNG